MREKLDLNKIDFKAMSEALNVEASEIKLVLKGPCPNIDQQSIEAIQTVEQACKLFKQAKSEHRKLAFDFAMELTGRYDEGFSFDADPFKLKAAEFANNWQALELLKQVVEGYADLQADSKLLQILIEKASVLFPKT